MRPAAVDISEHADAHHQTLPAELAAHPHAITHASLAARQALPDWTARPFIVQALPQRYRRDAPPAAGVVVSAPA